MEAEESEEQFALQWEEVQGMHALLMRYSYFLWNYFTKIQVKYTCSDVKNMIILN